MDDRLGFTDICFLLVVVIGTVAFHALLISFGCWLAGVLHLSEVPSCILVELLFTALVICYMLYEVRQTEKHERATLRIAR